MHLYVNIIILIKCLFYISAVSAQSNNQQTRPDCAQRRPSSEFEATCRQRLVCYFGSWSVYRADDGRFSVENIDPTRCTHLIYAFVGISGEPGIRVLDAYNDLRANYGRGAFSRFIKLKEINPDLRVLVSIGGQNEGSAKFSQAFNTSTKRQAFVQSSVKFLSDYGFDGLDLDWEYPTQKGGKPEDRENFSELLKELRTEFDKCGYTLSAFVSPTASTVPQSYNVEVLVQNLDFITIGTYNIHGPWDTRTGHNSPLYAAAEEIGTSNEEKNIDAAVKAWLTNGAPAHKLLIGVGFFGRSFTLSSTNCQNPRCARRGTGVAGPYTADPGFLGYNEICSMLIQRDTVVVFDEEAKVPYLVKGNQWVSYDNERSLQYKVDYVLQHQLGGIMAWSVDTDDFKSTCQNGMFPLLTTLQKVVNCKKKGYVVPIEPPSSTTSRPVVTRPQTRPLVPSYTTQKTTSFTTQIIPVTPITTQRTTPSTTQASRLTTRKTTTTTEEVVNKSPEDDDSSCLLPEFPSGGKYKILNSNAKLYPDDAVPIGTVLQFSCRKNYDVTHKHAFCQEDSTWSANSACNKRCKLPRSNTVDFICYNATQHSVECTPFVPSGSVVRFKCKDYHKNTNNFNYAMTCDEGSFDYGAPMCDPDCGLEPADAKSLIIDGLPVKRGTFPWHVAVYELRGEPTPQYEQICGGTLITTHLIVSAAHCFYASTLGRSNSAEKYAVAIGKLHRAWNDADDDSLHPVHKTKVRSIFIPDTYRGTALHHQSDIALLEMDVYVTFSNTIHPACIKLNDDEFDRYQTRPGNTGKVAGWGLTAEGGESSNELKYLSVPIIGFNQCLKEMEKYNFQQYLSVDKLCAGYLNGSAVCSGDSGGGLVIPETEVSTGYTRWYLRGIVSVGPTNSDKVSCRRDSYTAYTKVYYFKEWISNQFAAINV